jgi:hypothetical protein
MPPSLVRWTFHSPLRLLGTCLAVVGVLVGTVVLVDASSEPRAVARQPQPTVKATPTPTASPVDAPEPTSTPSEVVTHADRRAVTTAAEAFVDAWTSSARQAMTRRTWRHAIKPLTTPTLYRGLSVTDPSRLPQARVRRVRADAVGAFAADFTVTLTNGLRLEVRMVCDRGRWVAADIRPVGA